MPNALRWNIEIAQIAKRHSPSDLDAARTLAPDPARLGTLSDAVEQAEADHGSAIAARHDAHRLRDEAQGGDATARAVQDRATVLEDLRRGAREAAATLLGHMAGQDGVGTAGAGQPGYDGRGRIRRLPPADRWRVGRVRGVRCRRHETGTHVRVTRAPLSTGLSEGTRAQLFLALRVAGHASFCDLNGPLPFITDDILESFDDTRAEAALKMAAEMGSRGQVIFFTHHPHVVALARNAIPGVSVVDMPRQG